ncbi:MAG: hypothetical protein JOZ45_18890 [Acidobacteriaceae bacterium]|nr:hypothetical protein [Acidobacteriaceae bacterium]
MWQLSDKRHQSLYWDRTIYSLVDLSAECEQALALVSALTDEDLYRFSKNIPECWFSPNDKADWTKLLEQLSARKNQLPRMLNECLQTLHLDQQKGSLRAQTMVGCGVERRPPEAERCVTDPALLPALG